MRATEILMGEHRVIERVLSTLESAIERMSSKSARPGFFIDAAGFIQGFADAHHHKKEEDVLFEEMVACGLPKQDGPIAVMLAEHEQGREYTRAMLAAAQRWDGGDSQARDDVARNAQGYVALLRQHIVKEDQVLYPMAANVIPLDAQERMAETFERIEGDAAAARTRDKYLELAGVLEREIETWDTIDAGVPGERG